MRITLYVTKDDPHHVTKTFADLPFALTTISYLYGDGTLRIPTDVLNPTVTIDAKSLKYHDVNANEGPFDEVVVNDEVEYIIALYNYAYIDRFRRWYYITGARVVNSTLVEVSFKVDVLMTYKANFLALPAYVERSESNGTLSLEDNLLPFSYAKSVSETRHTTTFNLSAPGINEKFIALTSVVKLANDSALYADLIQAMKDLYPQLTTDAQAIEAMTARATLQPPTELSSILDDVSTKRVSPETYSFTYLMSLAEFEELQKDVLGDDALDSFIKGITAWPFTLQNVIPNDYDCPLVIGNKKIGDVVGRIWQTPALSKVGSYMGYLEVCTWSESINLPIDFMQLEPFRTLQVYLPFYGWADISFNLMYSLVSSAGVHTHVFSVLYSFDMNTGEGQVYFVRKSPAPRVIFTAPVNIGTRVALSSSNQKENEIARTSNAVNTTLGAIASVTSIAFGVATQNPVAVAGGIAGAMSTGAKAFTTNLGIRERGQVSYNGATLASFGEMDVVVRITSMIRTIQPPYTEYKRQFGLPYRQTVSALSSLSGFTVVGSIHLDFTGPNYTEIEELNTLLKQGVII